MSETELNLEDFNVWISEDYSFSLGTGSENTYYISDDLGAMEIGKPIKYLHQLQNLFFVLQERELYIQPLNNIQLLITK